MEQQPAGELPVVVLMDSMVLRRAAIASLLAGWAAANRVAIRAVAPEQGGTQPEPGSRCPLVILSLGGASVCDPEACVWLTEITAALPAAPVAVLSDRDSAEEVVAALRAGARGYVPASTEPEVALHALSFIMRGGSFFPPGALLARRANGPGRGGPEGPRASFGAAAARRAGLLTRTQQMILRHLQAGWPNKAIARALGMRESAVKVHVRQVMRKLGAANRTQAALAAIDLDLDLVEASSGLPDAPDCHGGTARPMRGTPQLRIVAGMSRPAAAG